jgi:hypothetical protein
VVLAMAASPHKPTAMAASLGTRMKTSPSTGPDDDNTHNYFAQNTGCTLSERREAGANRQRRIGIEGRHVDL